MFLLLKNTTHKMTKVSDIMTFEKQIRNLLKYKGKSKKTLMAYRQRIQSINNYLNQ